MAERPIAPRERETLFSLQESVERCVSLLVLALLFCTACNRWGEERLHLNNERDSLQTVIDRQNSEILHLQGYLDTLAVSLDSIRAQEKVLTLSVDENGRRLSRTQIRENLSLLEDVIARQRARIQRLESRLQFEKDSSGSKSALINYLYQQLDKKDKEINELRKSLSLKETTIRRMSSDLALMQDNVSALEQKSLEQNEIISRQQDILTAQTELVNTGYVKIGTRKELQDEGIITKGGLRKVSVNYSAINTSEFISVDMRDFREITIPARSITIMTAVPAGSYDIQQSGGNTILYIKNPASFWSISSYLIIIKNQ